MDKVVRLIALSFLITFLFNNKLGSGEKINLDSLNNYSEFLNFGDKKLHKLDRNNALENDIFKSKLEILGEVFKKNVDILKVAGKLDMVFLVDSSWSVGVHNFKSELKFIKKLLSDVTVDFNHTRVAVISFSSPDYIINHIDEISQPFKENNKCLLLTKELKNIEYYGGETYTLGAFQKAKEIFDDSKRNDSKKVLFLITDGYSNGGSPVELSTLLKSHQVTIFTVGIRTGNYKELYEISSNPGEFHSYLLDSFEEFEALARRALHADLRSGEYLPLGSSVACDALCEKGDCCDDKAICSCGTTTGHYSCICQPGYYGSGLKNNCIPCTAGTYSDGPNLCIPCPDKYHTTTPPAYGIGSCSCKVGFQADDKGGCKVLKCLKISIPPHGYLVKKKECGNVLNSACGIRCEIGYTMVGNSIRLCQANATWSGREPSCEVKTCSRLSVPKHGTMTCSQQDLDIVYDQSEKNLPVDTMCNFQCEKGKALIGSSQRSCLPLARWDGLKTSCKQIKCNKLPLIKYAKFDPISCTTGKQEYGKVCKIICQDGFKIRGPAERKCMNFHWENKFEETTCIDVTPPNLTCPNNITTTTFPGKKFGYAIWELQTVTDNSGLNITVWTKPSIKNIKEFKFPIGVTSVTYFAEDVFQNRVKCKFFITVEDKEPPTIENCESPPVFLTSDNKGDNVTWDEPEIYDNSQNVTTKKSHEFGYFKIGTTSVTYIAVDSSGNRNKCTINITLEDSHCTTLYDPQNGHSNCMDQSDGIQCVITCDEGYAVPLQQNGDLQEIGDNGNVSFLCNNDEAMWYNNEGLLFPECSVTEIPKEIVREGEISIAVQRDYCEDDKKLQEFENDIHLTLTEDLCSDNCSVSLSTECDHERNEEGSNRIVRKREVFEEVPHRNKNKKKVNVKFQVRGKYVDGNVTTIKYKNDTVTVKYLKSKFICPIGFVPRKNRCVQCPKGTFHNSTRNRCQSCDFGFYNDKLGQTLCASCPINHSTRKLHSKKVTDCKEQCPPGTHARKKKVKYSKRRPDLIFERTTLKPYCRSCPVGFYQPKYGQLKCIQCPSGTTTVTYRSTSVSQCIPTPETICNTSRNQCDKGRCIPDVEYEYSCECFPNYIGSFCEIKTSSCDSQPCLNAGVCTPKAQDYICSCPKGFSGKSCEIVEEKCAQNCSNNGVCIESDLNDSLCLCHPGYGGKNCEISIRYCGNVTCENNGSCIEEPNTFKCICSKGFIGRRCNILPCDYIPCATSETCLNLEVENASRNSYNCTCPEGYTGVHCLKKIDHCIGNPCLNHASCISNSGTYKCVCSSLYYGDHCEFRWNTKYMLKFPTYDVNDYIKLPRFQQDLDGITACLWIQTIDNFNYGSLLSYATRKYDNAFTITDYTGLVLYVNNQHIVTDILLSDGYWHHVCVLWERRDGFYQILVDGQSIKNGSGLAGNSFIEGNGHMVIGQEQDVIGGQFSQSESFIGNMAHIDIWSRALSYDEILVHLNDCNDTFFGDLYAWPEMQMHVRGNIQTQGSTFCQKCEDPKPLYNGFIDVADNLAFYSCYEGYKLSDDKYAKGRRCTKTTKWEGFYEPTCKKVYCGYPGYVNNAYSIGSRYYYQDKIQFECYEGYNLTGSSIITCTKNGTWQPNKPLCSGIQCIAFKKPENAEVKIISDLSMNEEFIPDETIFEIGTQIEMYCDESNNNTLIGANILTCLENGVWDFRPPTCISNVKSTPKPALACTIQTVPKPPDNSYIVADSLKSVENGTANFVQYKCRPGYKMFGSNVSLCIVDGYWTDPNITCEAIVCPKPPNMKNMVLKHQALDKGATYQFGNMVSYECIEGYNLFGTGSVIRCMPSGKWTRMQGKCIRKSCRKPSVSSPDTIIQGNSYLFGDKVVLSCSDGNDYEIVCDKNGNWVGDKSESC